MSDERSSCCLGGRFDYRTGHMVRVVHVVEEGADFETQRGVEHLSRELGPGFQTRVTSIGGRGTWRNVPAGVMGLREVTDADVIHAWGTRALTAAAIGARAGVLHTPVPELREKSVRWLRAVMAHRDAQIVTSTATQRRMLLTRGVAPDRCHLVRPGVAFARVGRRRDRELRAALGFDDGDVVMLAVGESTRGANHRIAAWGASILHVLDDRYKLLVWGRGEEMPIVRAFPRQQGLSQLMAVAEDRLSRSTEFEALLPAADVVLNTPTAPTATLPLAICMAAGLPIVSTVTYTVGELLEDRHTALMVSKAVPKAIAQRVIQLREDAELQWRVSDMARTEAYEYFALTRFLEQFRTVYRQVAAGERVSVPEVAPGAGLRFHGRG
jgi:glycosyltransferase involved in cell wall biosynthesis